MKNLSILLIVIFLNGCSISNESCQNDPFGEQYPNVKTDFKAVAKKGIDELFSNIKVTNEHILITDFVDIDTLNGGNSLSFVLSNSFKDSLVNLNKFNVLEVELNRYFKIGKNGIKILSRQVKSLLNQNMTLNYALIGSYSITNKQLIIFLKLVDLNSGVVEKSYMDTLDMSCEINSLAKSK